MQPAREVSRHILPTSATMLGVCVTVLSIGTLAPLGTLHWLFEKLLALGGLAFLASAALSFVSIRSRTQSARLEVIAELIFLAGLALLAAVTLVIVFAVA
jgi:hypothetical protein